MNACDELMAACGCVFWRVGGIKLILSTIEYKHCAERLHSSEQTLGRARLLGVSLALCFHPSRCNSNHSAPSCGFICLF